MGQDLGECGMKALARLGEPGIAALASYLEAKDERLRRRCAQVLAAIESDAARAVLARAQRRLAQRPPCRGARPGRRGCRLSSSCRLARRRRRRGSRHSRAAMWPSVPEAASTSFVETLDDQKRKQGWRVAIEALEELHCRDRAASARPGLLRMRASPAEGVGFREGVRRRPCRACGRGRNGT